MRLWSFKYLYVRIKATTGGERRRRRDDNDDWRYAKLRKIKTRQSHIFEKKKLTIFNESTKQWWDMSTYVEVPVMMSFAFYEADHVQRCDKKNFNLTERWHFSSFFAVTAQRALAREMLTRGNLLCLQCSPNVQCTEQFSFPCYKSVFFLQGEILSFSPEKRTPTQLNPSSVFFLLFRHVISSPLLDGVCLSGTNTLAESV